MAIQEKLAAEERKALLAAIKKHNGNVTLAAKETGMTHERMRYRITKVYPELDVKAQELRESAQGGRGRPRKAREGNRSKKSVLAAWNRHTSIAATAKDLNLPASTTRDLLVEYGEIETASELEDQERKALQAAIRNCKGSVTLAAKEVGMTHQRMQYRITNVYPELDVEARELREVTT